MSLLTREGSDIPEGCVKLTRDEALAHQKSTVLRWPSELEVFFLKFGHLVAGISTTITSAVMFSHFKRSFNADYRVWTIALLPGLVLPGYASAIQTEKVLTNNILLMKIKCPVCNQIKYAAQQYAFSLILPTIYAMSTCGVYAAAMKSYPFPDINKYPKEHWKEYWTVLKKGRKSLQVLGLLQTVLILLLPTMQTKELINIMEKIEKEEHESDIKNDHELLF